MCAIREQHIYRLIISDGPINPLNRIRLIEGSKCNSLRESCQLRGDVNLNVGRISRTYERLLSVYY